MEAHNPTTVEIKKPGAGAARARAPVVGAGEDGVMNEVVHRREGLRLDISFCGSDTGRDGSAVRRKGRGRGGQETLVEKTREDGRMSTPPPGCDAISSPGDARYGRPELTRRPGATRLGWRAAGKRFTGLFPRFGALTFARHLCFADVFSEDLRAGRRRFSDAEKARELYRMERRVRNAGMCS
jgi:hypothetical protein